MNNNIKSGNLIQSPYYYAKYKEITGQEVYNKKTGTSMENIDKILEVERDAMKLLSKELEFKKEWESLIKK